MAEATSSDGANGGGGRGFRFWRKKRQTQQSSASSKPEDASKTGCGGFFRRVRGPRGKMPVEKPVEASNGSQAQKQQVQISFDDVELPEAMLPEAKAKSKSVDSDGNGSNRSSVNSVCEEVVRVSVKQAESAWVRPPVAPPASNKDKPKLSLAKMSSKDGGSGGPPQDDKQPRRPSADKQPTSPAVNTEPLDEAEMERQRIAEARFQRKSVDMRNVKAKGGVKIEQNPQSEMWWNIVNKSLVGTGLFVRAVVCSLQSGGIYACNPSDFAPTVDQVAALRDNFQNPGAFVAAGFAIGSDLYKMELSGCTKDMLSAVNLQHTEGLLIVRSQTAMMIGGFAASRDQARETLSDMRDLFVSQGL